MAFSKKDGDRLDLRLFMEGGLQFYRKHDYFNEHLEQLKGYGYKIIRLDCTTWGAFTEHLEDSLGRIIDSHLHDLGVALNFFAVPSGGVVFSFENFERLIPPNLGLVYHFLVEMVEFSRVSILFDQRVLTLIQTDNEDIGIDSFYPGTSLWQLAPEPGEPVFSIEGKSVEDVQAFLRKFKDRNKPKPPKREV
ncbi:MAG: hypothetical protein IPH06_06405 [Alphaproteobacteria bacterium]|nr:hypothetical protein [Alphaproteobacteria bacterium]QQS57650.1 MAG: hypothetical protein IPN28_02170 [Alphaproteobacteria bacterium]